MAEPNAVAWNFEKKGLFLVPREGADEEALMELALEAGAEDLEPAGAFFEVHAPPEAFEAVREALEKGGVPIESARTRHAAQIDGPRSRAGRRSRCSA